MALLRQYSVSNKAQLVSLLIVIIVGNFASATHIQSKETQDIINPDQQNNLEDSSAKIELLQDQLQIENSITSDSQGISGSASRIGELASNNGQPKLQKSSNQGENNEVSMRGESEKREVTAGSSYSSENNPSSQPQYESASAHLNQALNFDTQSLIGAKGQCPSLGEIAQVNDWLYAWLDLMADPSQLEQDLGILKAVKGLILASKQHILLANGMPATFAENLKEITQQKANYIDIIYGAEMSQVYAQVHLMETFQSVQKSLSLCETILQELDYLIGDINGILQLQDRYPEFVCICQKKIAEMAVLKRDCYDDQSSYQYIDGCYADPQTEDQKKDDTNRKRIRVQQSVVADVPLPEPEDDGLELDRNVFWDESDQQGQSVKQQITDGSQLQVTRQVGISLFFRWSPSTPRLLKDWNVFHTSNSCQQVARLTETTNQTDQKIGDRYLTVLVCPQQDGNLALRFTGYDLETQNWSLEFDVDTTYEQLDGQWIWIYFGYHQKFQKSVCGAYFTLSNRWVIYEFSQVKQTKFDNLEYLRFVVGGSHGLLGLNALYSQPSYENHRGAFKATQEDVKSLYKLSFLLPQLGVYSSENDQEIALEEYDETDFSGYTIDKTKFTGLGMKYSGAWQYSFRSWFWFQQPVNGGKDEHSVIWVTGNQQARFGQGNNWQDNFLVIYLTRQEIRVCTYTLGANGNESGEKQICSTHLLTGRRSEMYWIYLYFSYSRVTRTWYLLINIDGKNYEFRREIRHMRLGYLGWYWLYDGFRSGFRGSAKKSFFSIGEKYVTNDAARAIQIGGDSPAGFENTDTSHFNIFDRVFQLYNDVDGESSFRGELPKSVAREATEFRVEFWSRISLTNPRRQLDDSFLRTGCRQLARVYEGVYNAHSENKFQDRFMLISYCGGANYQYRFSTYYENVAEGFESNSYSIDSNFSELESTWNYIYMGYDQKINKAFAGVYFSFSDRLSTINIAATRERGKPYRIGFIVGAGFGWRTVNSLIQRIRFRWDDQAYLSSAQEILENLDGENVKPAPQLPTRIRWRLIGEGSNLQEILDGELSSQDGEHLWCEQEETLNPQQTVQNQKRKCSTGDGENSSQSGQENVESAEVDGEQQIDLDGEFKEGIFRDLNEQNSGAKEWSFYGWFQYDVPGQPSNIPVSILRVIFNDPKLQLLNGSKNFGDQVAGLYIVPENIEVCTSSIAEAITSKVQVRECASSAYGNDLAAWIWFYIGYSRVSGRWKTHIQYEDRLWHYELENVLHIIPHWSGIYFGGDPFLAPFKGKLRNFEAFFGPGSLVQGSLDFLIENNPPRQVREAMLRAFGDDLAYILSQSRMKSRDYVYKLELPPNLLDDVYSVSYSFWFRMSTQIPEKLIDFSYLQSQEYTMMLARAFDCEISDFDSNQKERFLAVWVQNGRVVFGGFDEVDQTLKTADGEMPFSELEGSWNWVYVGISFETQKIVGAQYNIDNGQWEFVEIPEVRKDNPLEYLKFITGSSFGLDTINGHFYDVRFNFQENTLLQTPKEIQRFFKQTIPTPQDYVDSKQIISILATQEQEYFQVKEARPEVVSTSSDKLDAFPKGTYRSVDMTEQLQNNTEYCVYGWFKWVEPEIKRDSHLVIRLSNNIPQYNFDFQGDSTFSIFITPGNLDFVTYNIADLIGATNHPREAFQVDYGNDLEAWIFFYFGYERLSQIFTLFVRFQDRTQRISGSALHFSPNYFNLFLGLDDYHHPFKGYMQGITVEAGNGAYRSGDVKDLLMKNIPQEMRASLDAANGKDQEGMSVSTTLSSSKPTYQLEIPPELVQQNEVYTFAMWTKFSFSYPVRLFDTGFLENSETLVIARFANCEIEDTDNRKSARFAALLWRKGEYFLQAYDENSETLLETEHISVQVNEIQGRWVWSMVTFSTTDDKVRLALYIASSQRWQFQQLAITKQLPLPTLKFLAGPSFGLRSINGVFFDTRFEFQFFETDQAIQEFFENQVNQPSDLQGYDGDGQQQINLLEAEAFFDATVDAPPSMLDLKEQYGGVREYAIRGWFRYQGSELGGGANVEGGSTMGGQQGAVMSGYASGGSSSNTDRLVFRFTMNNPYKYENRDDSRLGDRVLSLIIQANGDLYFDTYSYNNDWSVGNERDLEYRQSSSNDLYDWIFVYFGMNIETKTLAWHVRFKDHVKTKIFKNVYHYIPSWLGLYLGRDPFTQPFHGKMSSFQILFGKGSFIQSNFRRMYDPRPPQLDIDTSKITGNDFQGRFLEYSFRNTSAAYQVELPPEMLEDVSDYEVSFWFRHSANTPLENLGGWDLMFKKCTNILRIRETQEGDAEYLGDRSAMLMVCPTRDGKITLRAATYDVTSDNSNLIADEPILYSELEGSWMWIYVGYSKAANSLNVLVKLNRSQRDISITIPAVHLESTEKLFLQLGNDGYLPQLQGTFYDIRFDWGTDGEFKADAAQANAFYEADYKYPEIYDFGAERTQEKIIVEDWTFNTRTTSEDPHFTFQDDYDGAEDYAVFGWHRWDFIPDQSSWYLIYRLHTNENPSNAEQLGDRALAFWIGDGIYHPATFNTADQVRVADPNVWSTYNYNNRDLVSWVWTYQCYSRKTKTYFFYAWTNGQEVILKKENIVHFVPSYFGFYIGKDPWHRSFNGRLYYFGLRFGAGAFRTEGFEEWRLKRWRTLKSRTNVASNTFIQEKGKEQVFVDWEWDPIELNSVQEYGFSFYYRWSQRTPAYIRDPYFYLNECYLLARFTEGVTDAVELGDRSLGAWLCPSGRNPGIYVDTYDLDGNNKALGRLYNIQFQDFDGIWNFFYFAYSQETNKAIFYAQFGNSGEEIYEEFASQHFANVGYLRFQVGPHFHKPAVGYYYGVNFGFNEGIYQANKDAVIGYMKKQGKPAALAASYSLNGVFQEYSYEMNEPETQITEFTQNSENAFEYAVFGHFKWTPPANRQEWHLLFRFSTSERSNFGNLNSLGDRDLAVWVHSTNFIHFTTYDFSANSNTNVWSNQPFDYNQFANQWFFIYFGYSRTLGKAVWYLKFQSAEYKGEIKANHFLPASSYLRVGKDEWHYAWNGDVKHIQVAFGAGAFRTDQYDQLIKLKVKLSADEEQYQGIPEFAFGDKSPAGSDVHSKKPVAEHVFNMEQLTSTIDYSWSVYYKHSWKNPNVILLSEARSQFLALGGITKVDSSFWKTSSSADRVLAAFLWPLQYETGYSLCTYNDDNQISSDCQTVSTGLDEYELGWTWFYMGYSTRRQKAYAVVYFSLTNKYIELSWPGRQHIKKNMPALKFVLGSDGDWSANGRFFDARVDYGPGSYFGNLEDVVAYKDQFVPSPPAAYQTQFKDNTLGKAGEDFWVGRNQDSQDLDADRKFEYSKLETLEYSIHGWFRWIGDQPDTWNSLFRVSTNQANLMGNAEYIGDRALAVWNGPGYLHFTTSHYGANSGDNWNYVKNWERDQFIRDSSWVFVYMGYNRASKKLFAYAQNGQGNWYMLTVTGARHQVAQQFRVFIGRDYWHMGTNGLMRDWHFKYGPGSYQEKDMELLINKQVTPTPRTNFQPADQINESHQQQQIQQQNFLNVVVPTSDLPNALQYSYSYWFKFAFFPGTTQISKLRAYHHTLSGFTEKGTYDDPTPGGMNLVLIFKSISNSVGFIGLSYDLNCNNGCVTPKTVEGLGLEDIQNSWARIYMGYSHQRRAAFAYIGLESTNQVFTMEWPGILHQQPMSSLELIVGGLRGANYLATPGYFADLRTSWKSGSFLSTATDVQQYFETVSVRPKLFDVLREMKTYQVIDDRAISVGRNDAVRRFSEASANFGAQEYAWWGWFKWEEPSYRDTWHLMVRLSFLENHLDYSYLGDRSLNLWLNPNGEYLHFSTFHVRHNGGDNTNWAQNMPASYDDYSRWFWVYFGYNYRQQRAFAYVQFNSGERTLEWNSVHHLLPVYTTWYLCKDQYYAGFSGKVRKFIMSFGQGSFLLNGYEERQKYTRTGTQPQLVEFEDSENFDTYVNHFSAPNDPVINYKLEDLEDFNITDYSFSFYYQANLAYPDIHDLGVLRSTWRFLGGLSENGDCSPSGRKGDRTLCIYDRFWNLGAGTHWTTYDTRSGNNNWYQEISQDYLKDYDNQWNFVYFGYSGKLKKAFGYIKYSRSQAIQTLSWNDVYHINPLQQIVFQLGKTSSYKFGINGFFGQIKLNFRDDSFFSTKDQVDSYLSKAYKLPLTRPKWTKVQLIDDAERTFSDTTNYDAEAQYYVPIQGGAEEYAIYGWMKAQVVNTYWTPLFRVTPNRNYNDLGYLGDRDFAAWINWADKSIYPSSSQYSSDNWNRYSSFEREEEDLNDWFWVYMGYSYAKKRTIVFVRYNDHERQIIFDDQNKFIPYGLYINIAQDKFYKTFQGQVKSWFVEYGFGAFRQSGFLSLHQTPLNTGKLGQTDAAYGRARAVYDVEPSIDELKDITEYAYSFYFRASLQAPSRLHLGSLRGEWLAIAGITETGDYSGVGLGDRSLALWNWPWNTRAGYHFTTYDLNTNNGNRHQEIEYDWSFEYDGSWNFIYFGYSLTDKKAFAFVQFGRTGRVASLGWANIAHTNPPQKLQFLVGRSASYNQITGRYTSISFNYKKGAFISDENVLNNSFLGKVTLPTNQLRLTQFVSQDINNGATVSLSRLEAYDRSRNNVYNDALGAEEYSWYGWNQWEGTTQDVWNLIGRLTWSQDGGNLDWWNDRTLSCWLGPGYVHFTTYNFCQNGCDDFNVITNSADYSDDIYNWFFIHFSYSMTKQKVTAYVRWDQNGREQELVLNNIMHFTPEKLIFMQGKDQWHPAFNGQMQGYRVQYGPGAYRQGIPAYLNVMYKTNAQSATIRVVESRSKAENIAFIETSIQNSACETCFDAYLQSGDYQRFNEDSNKIQSEKVSDQSELTQINHQISHHQIHHNSQGRARRN